MQRKSDALLSARFVAQCLGLLLGSVGIAFAGTDVVHFPNGDRLTGAVKRLERGRLFFDTDATGVIGIEWEDVAYLSSNQNLRVELQDGHRFFGPLIRAEGLGQLQVQDSRETVVVDMLDVTWITPIERTLASRIDADVRVGYSYAQASDTAQTNLGFNASYRTDSREFGFTSSATSTDSRNNDTSTRFNTNFEYRHLWPRRWFTGALAFVERNDELGLDQRTSAGVGGGQYVRQTNSHVLAWYAGLLYSQEDIAAPVANENSFELPITVEFDWFRYDSPQLDLSGTLQVIPNLSDTGRVRSNLDLALKWELIADLFWELTFYDRYDSDPPAPDAENNDYGVVLSLGYSF
ncbi:MAG: DUF481 domain-containing protein [Pseudomonadota bacterium]